MIFHSLTFARSRGEVLKTSSFALSFQHFLNDLANVNDKIMFDRNAHTLS